MDIHLDTSTGRGIGIDTNTGKVVINGFFYTGYLLAKNNPYFENVRDAGPLPQGIWRIGPVDFSEKVGEYFKLSPIEVLGLHVLKYNRDFWTFLIHGDSITNPGYASTGCLIMGPKEREIIKSHGGGRVLAIDLSVSSGAYLVGPSGYPELMGSRYPGPGIGWSSGDVHLVSPGGQYFGD